jgi:hypothetical protein
MAGRSGPGPLSCAVAEVLRARRGGAVRWVEPLEDRRLLSVTVNIGGDLTIDEGSNISLTLSAYDGGNALYVSGWTIDWGDGSSPESTTDPNPTHGYDDGDATYNLSVVAHVDDTYFHVGGDYDEDAEVVVENVDPFVWMGGDSTVYENTPFSVYGYYQDVGDDHVSSWSIDWGDGSSGSGGGSSEAGFSHEYDLACVDHTITLTVTDDDGSYTVSRVVSVQEIQPGISTSGDSGGREGLDAIAVNGSYSHPGDHATGWTIDWGDGATNGGSGETISESHVYPDDDDYTITIGVSDDDGRTFSFTRTADVTNVAPEIVLGSPDNSLLQGDEFTLTASTSDPGEDTISGWSINWGDGSTTNHSGNPTSFTHRYAVAGNFTVSATATDEDGSYTRTYEVSVAALSLTSLTVTNSDDSTQTATVTDSSGATVSVDVDSNGETSLDLTGVVSPNTSEARSHARYAVYAPTGTRLSEGSLANGATVTLNWVAINDIFATVAAGIDMDRDGELDPEEVTREITAAQKQGLTADWADANKNRIPSVRLSKTGVGGIPTSMDVNVRLFVNGIRQNNTNFADAIVDPNVATVGAGSGTTGNDGWGVITVTAKNQGQTQLEVTLNGQKVKINVIVGP